MNRTFLLLATSWLLLLPTGCGHGPAVSSQPQAPAVKYCYETPETVRRISLTATRFRDAQGREWTETTESPGELLPLAELEREMFQSALKASALPTHSR